MERTTIAALCTPAGAGERAAIRISGARTRAIVRELVRSRGAPPELALRGFVRGRLLDGRGEQPVLVLWMPAPHSYTREDVAELHLVGSPFLAAAALERVLALGAMLAAPGEFTRRAFESGRIDLTRAEGVLTLVHARSEEEARAARALLFGGLGERTASARDALADLRALCEASLDFAEADAGHVETAELAGRARAILASLASALEWEERRTAAGGAARAVLTGAPNAGKSALFNRLTRGRALVSAHPGTTRDPLSAEWHPVRIACRLTDTAGIEPGESALERASQELAAGERAGADLTLWVVDASTASTAVLERLEREWGSLERSGAVLLAWNKIDLVKAAPRPPERWLARGDAPPWVALSAATGAGVEELEERAAALLERPDGAAPSTGVARELALRHRAGLLRARDELAHALELLERSAPLDLTAEGLRAATDALDEIEGRTTSEDVLDRIFARFCIGK